MVRASRAITSPAGIKSGVEMLFRKAKSEASLEEVILEQLAVPIAGRVGALQCSGISCSNKKVLGCSYVDRRGRNCKTMWCATHRHVYAGKVYCALHASTIAGIDSEYGESIHPDLENRLPAIVNWVSRNAEDDIVATMASIARGRGEMLVSDPVRMVLHTVGRIKTWERAWKSCSTSGVSCRVSISIEEKDPDELEVRVNSRVVARIPTPWELAAGTGQPDLDTKVFRQIVMPVSFALDQWQQGFLPDEHDPERPATPEAALDLVAQIMADQLGMDAFEDDEEDEGEQEEISASTDESVEPLTFVGALSSLAKIDDDPDREGMAGSVPAAQPRSRTRKRSLVARRAVAPYHPRRR
jgi:hypothetical protein